MLYMVTLYGVFLLLHIKEMIACKDALDVVSAARLMLVLSYQLSLLV